MRSLGGWLIFFAVASAILRYFGLYFLLFFWIDNWGSTIGWIIRAVMAMAGIALIIFAPRKAPTTDAPPTQPTG